MDSFVGNGEGEGKGIIRFEKCIVEKKAERKYGKIIFLGKEKVWWILSKLEKTKWREGAWKLVLRNQRERWVRGRGVPEPSSLLPASSVPYGGDPPSHTLTLAVPLSTWYCHGCQLAQLPEHLSALLCLIAASAMFDGCHNFCFCFIYASQLRQRKILLMAKLSWIVFEVVITIINIHVN